MNVLSAKMLLSLEDCTNPPGIKINIPQRIGKHHVELEIEETWHSATLKKPPTIQPKMGSTVRHTYWE